MGTRNDDISLILAKAKKQGFLPDVSDSEVDILSAEASEIFKSDYSLGGLSLVTNPANFNKIRSKFAGVRNGTTNAKILCLGDSTTWGAKANGGVNDTLSSYPQRLATQLNSFHIASSVTFHIPQSFHASDVDSRWVYGTSWSKGPSGFGNGSAASGTVGAGNLTFTPGYNCDTFEVYYIANGGTCQASINGGAATPLSGSGGTIQKVTLTVAAGGSNILTVNTVTTATVHIIGVEAYLSTEKKVRVGNAGVSGSTATHWATAGTNYIPAECIKAFAPDLSIIMLGINDALGFRTVAQFEADILKTVDAAKISGDVILCSVVPSSYISASGLEEQYRSSVQALATKNNFGYIDIFGRFGSYTTANSNGFMSDLVHPNGIGYTDIASAVSQVVKQIT